MSEGLKVSIYVTEWVQVPMFRHLHVHVNIYICLCGWTRIAFLYVHMCRQISLCLCMCMHKCRHAIHVCACIRHIHLCIQDACVCGCGCACMCIQYSLGGLKHFPEPGPGLVPFICFSLPGAGVKWSLFSISTQGEEVHRFFLSSDCSH